MKMRSVLLVAPRYSDSQTPSYRYWFPLGLGFISAAMKKAGHEVECLNLNHTSGPVEQIIRNALSGRHYDAVATGGNAIHVRGIKAALDSVRKVDGNLATICGGPIITSEPELIYSYLTPTYGVLGEGEETIVELVANLDGTDRLRAVPGLIFRDNQGIRTTPSRVPSIDINDLPYPDLDGLGFEERLSHSFCNEMYWNSMYDKPRLYCLIGSRGCPYNCTFCWHYSEYRKRTIDNIVEELAAQIPRYKINDLFLMDECFSLNKERVYEFCDKFELLRRTIPWHIGFQCQLTVRGVDRELLSRLKSVGCHTVSLGFESYSEEVLRSMKKGIRPQQIDAALRAMFAVGVQVMAHFIFGDPAETLETARTTLAYWREHCKGQVLLGLVQPYPGSQVFKYCVERGLIPDKLRFIETTMINSTLNMSRTMTDSEFQTMRQEIASCQSMYAERGLGLITSSNGDRDFYTVRFKCPFCRGISVYHNVFLPDRSKSIVGTISRTTLVCRKCRKWTGVVCCSSKLRYKSIEWQPWLVPFRRVWNYGRKLSRFVRPRSLSADPRTA
jgi:anaerobic magnesium-protoporphyrin IX monomethyl ester cyclase